MEAKSSGSARSLRRSTRSKRSRQPPPALRTVPEEDEVLEDDPRTDTQMETIAEDDTPGDCEPGEATQGTQVAPSRTSRSHVCDCLTAMIQVQACRHAASRQRRYAHCKRLCTMDNSWHNSIGQESTCLFPTSAFHCCTKVFPPRTRMSALCSRNVFICCLVFQKQEVEMVFRDQRHRRTWR